MVKLFCLKRAKYSFTHSSQYSSAQIFLMSLSIENVVYVTIVVHFADPDRNWKYIIQIMIGLSQGHNGVDLNTILISVNRHLSLFKLVYTCIIDVTKHCSIFSPQVEGAQLKGNLHLGDWEPCSQRQACQLWDACSQEWEACSLRDACSHSEGCKDFNNDNDYLKQQIYTFNRHLHGNVNDGRIDSSLFCTFNNRRD